jgi:hypothetical protein
MAAEKAAIPFPLIIKKAPKARQPRWQIASCAQHAVAFPVVIPEGDLLCPFKTPSRPSM